MRPTKLILLGVAAVALAFLPKRSSKKTPIQTKQNSPTDEPKQAASSTDELVGTKTATEGE